jgi:hypothetical protein
MMNHFKKAVEKVMGSDPQLRLHKYPESLVISPDLFKKLVAPPSIRGG